MKITPFFPLVLVLSLACWQPLLAQAPDDNQKHEDKKDTKDTHGHQKPDKAASQTAKPNQPGSNAAYHSNKVHSDAVGGGTFQRSNAQVVTHVENQGNAQRGNAQFTKPQGDRSNHYGGHWVEASQHPDWGDSGEHIWRHHHYRWYDGGWIIIDTPVTAVYSTDGGIASAVQEKLGEQGYYHGPVDGDIGPGSSRAIANYQDDHGLRVTGNINDALVQSLGLQ